MNEALFIYFKVLNKLIKRFHLKNLAAKMILYLTNFIPSSIDSKKCKLRKNSLSNFW